MRHVRAIHGANKWSWSRQKDVVSADTLRAGGGLVVKVQMRTGRLQPPATRGQNRMGLRAQCALQLTHGVLHSAMPLCGSRASSMASPLLLLVMYPPWRYMLSLGRYLCICASPLPRFCPDFASTSIRSSSEASKPIRKITSQSMPYGIEGCSPCPRLSQPPISPHQNDLRGWHFSKTIGRPALPISRQPP